MAAVAIRATMAMAIPESLVRFIAWVPSPDFQYQENYGSSHLNRSWVDRSFGVHLLLAVRDGE